jgi:Spy/CpxP family protein refolding chaperone
MEQMVVARMTEALRLSEDQKAKVIPRVQELMRARRDHAAKRRAALARLRGLLQEDTAGDQEIGQALGDVRALEDEFRAREAGLREAIDRDLTPRQQARMVFFEARLRRVMQHRIQEALRGERGAGPGRRPGPPAGRRSVRQAPMVEDSPDESDAPEDDL